MPCQGICPARKAKKLAQGFSKVAFSAATQRPYGCHFDQREKSLRLYAGDRREISPRRLVEMTKFIDF
jgi:hypothetical protein